MPKFKSFSDDSLSYATIGVASFEEKIRNNPTSNEWLADFFKDHKLQNTKYDFDIELQYDDEAVAKYDFENAKLIYETFESLGIGKAIIFNNKFIPAFALQYGYRYYTSHLLSPKENIKSVSGTLFFAGDPRRSMARNIVGRLYLLTVLSLDERLDDKYEYTRYIMQHPGLRRMVYYTFVDNDIARLAFIKSVIRFEKETGTRIGGTKMHKILTHLSCLSNVSQVDIMNEDEVENYLYNYIKELEG